jgi:Flp pilus assembly protein CpaB
MAKQKDMQLLPSGGVLAVALVAAVAAAVLVNLYIGRARADYDLNSKVFIQVKSDTIPQGTIMQSNFFRDVRLPNQALVDGDFTAALTWDQMVNVEKKQARRTFYKGEFLLANDITIGATSLTDILKLKPGQTLVSIPVSADTNFGRLLQPGVFVSVSGGFNVDPNPKMVKIDIKEVIPCVQIKAIDGSLDAVTDSKARSIKTIQVVVRNEIKNNQAMQLQAIIQELRPTKAFSIAIMPQPEQVTDDCVINPAVLTLVRNRAAEAEAKADAATKASASNASSMFPQP